MIKHGLFRWKNRAMTLREFQDIIAAVGPTREPGEDDE
jgi:hypothetical protein